VALVELPGRWWVAHTRSRNEKVVARSLLAAEVPYFLPMYTRRSVRRGRRFESMAPLFPGYVFFSGDDDARLAVLKTNRAAGIIEVADQGRLIAELAQIDLAVGQEADFDPYPGLVRGRRCRVVAGALVGVEGVIETRRGVSRLVLQVTALGQAVSVEVDIDTVEPV